MLKTTTPDTTAINTTTTAGALMHTQCGRIIGLLVLLQMRQKTFLARLDSGFQVQFYLTFFLFFFMSIISLMARSQRENEYYEVCLKYIRG